MALDQLLRKRFGLVVLLPLVAVVALLNAQAVSQLVGIGLMPDEKDLARPPPASRHVPQSSASTRTVSADPILARNPFDHVTGPLRPPPSAEGSGDALPSGPIDTSDIWNVPVCDGVDVTTIVASDEEDWSLAALSGSDGKRQLHRRGDEIAGKKVHFIGWDRVWLESAGSLCQTKVFDAKKAAAPVASATPTPVPSTSASTLNRRGAKPVDADIKKGIQKVSDTEFNVDRGTLDKILENQADLMRQARVRPVQQNGRTVGISMNGIRDDSLLGVLGMKNGDQLRTINGFDMTSPEKALEAYARLRTADKLTVQVNRNGKDMNLDYNIR
jgi:general secretion pathway protein C